MVNRAQTHKLTNNVICSLVLLFVGESVGDKDEFVKSPARGPISWNNNKNNVIMTKQKNHCHRLHLN